jgi:hypothetical protein
MGLVLSTQNLTQHEKDFFITEALTGLDTLNNGLLYVAEGIKNDKYVIPVLNATPKLYPRSSFPTSHGTTTLSNKEVNLGAFEVYEEFNPDIFENHWHQDQLTNMLLQRGLPSTFANYLGSYYTQKSYVPLESAFHMGSVGYTASAATDADPNFSIKHFDGIIRQAIVGSAPQVGSPSAITPANILAKFEAAKLLVKKAILSKPNRYKRLKYLVSVEDAQKFEEALTSTTFKNNDTTEAGINKYKGYQVIALAGIPENTFYLCEATSDVESNLHLAVTALDNMTFEINKVQNNSEMHYYKSKMKCGVGIAKFDEFVMHTTKVAADFIA